MAARALAFSEVVILWRSANANRELGQLEDERRALEAIIRLARDHLPSKPDDTWRPEHDVVLAAAQASALCGWRPTAMTLGDFEGALRFLIEVEPILAAPEGSGGLWIDWFVRERHENVFHMLEWALLSTRERCRRDIDEDDRKRLTALFTRAQSLRQSLPIPR